MADDKLLPADLSGTISPDANHPDDLAAMYAEINKPKGPPEPPKDVPCGGDEIYYVEPLAKWRDELLMFVVPYIDDQGPNFWKPVEIQRPIFVDACEKAGNHFADRGSLWPIEFSDDAIEIHLHPFSPAPPMLGIKSGIAPRVVFLFKKEIVGVKHECAIEYILSHEQVGFLKTTNRWPKGKPRSVN